MDIKLSELGSYPNAKIVIKLFEVNMAMKQGGQGRIKKQNLILHLNFFGKPRKKLYNGIDDIPNIVLGENHPTNYKILLYPFVVHLD